MRWILVIGAMLLTACATTHDLGGGKYLVPRAVEDRSPFGTNTVTFWTEKCDGKVDPKQFGLVYDNCVEATPKSVASSQGQGGQMIQGLLQASGFWGLGALMPSVNGGNASSTSSATSNAVSSGGHGGHK